MEESKVETQKGKAVKICNGNRSKDEMDLSLAGVKQLLSESEKEKRPKMA